MLSHSTPTAYVEEPSPSREGLQLLRQLQSCELLALAATLVPGVAVGEAGTHSLTLLSLIDDELADRERAAA